MGSGRPCSPRGVPGCKQTVLVLSLTVPHMVLLQGGSLPGGVWEGGASVLCLCRALSYVVSVEGQHSDDGW